MSRRSLRPWRKSPQKNKHRSPHECINLMGTDLVDAARDAAGQ
jgi:hypothetical protein